jgi:hypothetical protein
VIRSCSGDKRRVGFLGEREGNTTAESRKVVAVGGVAEFKCCWLRSCRVEAACTARGDGSGDVLRVTSEEVLPSVIYHV